MGVTKHIWSLGVLMKRKLDEDGLLNGFFNGFWWNLPYLVTWSFAGWHMIHISVEWDGWCNIWRRGVDGVELDFLMPSVATGEWGKGWISFPSRKIHSCWLLSCKVVLIHGSPLTRLEKKPWWIPHFWIPNFHPHFWMVFPPYFPTDATAWGYLAPFDSVTEQLRAKMEVAAKPKEEVEEEERKGRRLKTHG